MIRIHPKEDLPEYKFADWKWFYLFVGLLAFSGVFIVVLATVFGI